MLPAPLAPLDPHKTRVLTNIYAPRKLKTRTRTAEARMLDKNVAIKPTLSPFHPLPAIGQKLERSKTKIIVFDLNKTDSNSLNRSINVHEVLKPLTPITIHHFKRKTSQDQLGISKPQQLLRENTYDVINPVYVNVGNMRVSVEKEILTPKLENSRKETKVSPKTRFKEAALQVAKLSSMPETGKLLCLRERQTYDICPVGVDKSSCLLQNLPQSPPQQLDKLSEIFQRLETNGRHRDKMKKENSWF